MKRRLKSKTVCGMVSPIKRSRWWLRMPQLRGTHAQTSGPGTTADLYLGHRGTGGPSLFQGWMDEARIAAAARSSAWMDASYLTVASNDWFTAYAEALPQATNLAVVARSASDFGATYATLNGVVAHTGDASIWASMEARLLHPKRFRLER